MPLSFNKKHLFHLLKNSVPQEYDKLKKAFCDAFFAQESPRWWKIADGTHAVILDKETGRLWQYLSSHNQNVNNVVSVSEGTEYFKKLTWLGLTGWRLPTAGELKTTQAHFPLSLLGKSCWLSQSGPIDQRSTSNIDRVQSFFGTKYSNYINYINYSNFGSLIGIWDHWQSDFKTVGLEKILQTGQGRTDWQLTPIGTTNKETHPCSTLWQALHQKYLSILAIQTNQLPDPAFLATLDWLTILKELDYTSVRLPKLDTMMLNDPKQGLWELWSPPTRRLPADRIALPDNLPVRARSPEMDVREEVVAIDFGTSSTVVAFREGAEAKLLRIGVQADKMWRAPEAKDFENPTVIQFLDWQGLIKAWQDTIYRPPLLWDIHFRCAHEALTELRNEHNQTDARILSSILTRLKQWALRENEEQQYVRITDFKNHEERLAAYAPLAIEKGQPLEITEGYSFDPIELYAWCLGMCINWRRRGIFLRYYLTFPVNYSLGIKNKILTSFTRGIQRSFPENLLKTASFEKFRVEERASEPTAYAAAALPLMNIAPSKTGIPYAVFDFGGGTTDFDFGFYRWATDDEANEGWEEVIEHFGTAGDKFLGGENLLENVAYLVFRTNLETCREKRIQFTKPLDAVAFPGSEMLLARSQFALTNMTILMSQLRVYLEQGIHPDADGSGLIKLYLFNTDGTKIDLEFTWPAEQVNTYLDERIAQGFHAFLSAMAKAFAPYIRKTAIETIHVLLAGNSSRSPWVKNYLDQEQYLEILSPLLQGMTLKIHAPLEQDANDPYRPTAKTGVALGLLRLCPGEPLKVINHAANQNDDQAPFLLYVGKAQRGQFVPCLKAHDPYEQWQLLGPVLDGVFKLVYTDSPLAVASSPMSIKDPALRYKSLDFTGDTQGQKVFVRATHPYEIETCLAPNIQATRHPKEISHVLKHILKTN